MVHQRTCNEFLNGSCKNGSMCPFSHSTVPARELLECSVPGCGRFFASKWGLKCHQKSHDANSAIFKCSSCPKTFRSKGDRNKHEKRHGSKQYKCTWTAACTRVFKTDLELRNHVLRKHDQANMPHGCTIPGCSSRFVSPHDVRRHLAKAHKTATVDDASPAAPGSKAKRPNLRISTSPDVIAPAEPSGVTRRPSPKRSRSDCKKSVLSPRVCAALAALPSSCSSAIAGDYAAVTSASSLLKADAGVVTGVANYKERGVGEQQTLSPTNIGHVVNVLEHHRRSFMDGVDCEVAPPALDSTSYPSLTSSPRSGTASDVSSLCSNNGSPLSSGNSSPLLDGVDGSWFESVRSPQSLVEAEENSHCATTVVKHTNNGSVVAANNNVMMITVVPSVGPVEDGVDMLGVFDKKQGGDVVAKGEMEKKEGWGEREWDEGYEEDMVFNLGCSMISPPDDDLLVGERWLNFETLC